MTTHNTTYRCPVLILSANGVDGSVDQLAATLERAYMIKEAIGNDSFWSGDQSEYVNDWDNREILESVHFNVMYSDGHVWGLARVVTTEELTATEEESLIGEITGQFSDGWGESFEQEDIGEGPGMFSASFWNFHDSWKLEKI